MLQCAHVCAMVDSVCTYVLCVRRGSGSASAPQSNLLYGSCGDATRTLRIGIPFILAGQTTDLALLLLLELALSRELSSVHSRLPSAPASAPLIPLSSNLLDTLSYTPSSDTLIFSGDMLAKSTHAGSLAVLDFITQHHPCAGASLSPPVTPAPAPNPKPRFLPARGRVYAVRGNHDQMVVQWRAWREWFTALELPLPAPGAPEPTGPDGISAGPPVGTGREFLELIEKEWEKDVRKDPQGASDADEWADVARKRAVGTWRAEWWRRIPEPGKGRAKKDWHIFTDHYWLARWVSISNCLCTNH